MNDHDFQGLYEWWKGLENDRGGRAELKRALSPADIVFCNAYHRLYNRLRWPDRDRDKLAAIAGLAAHVRENNDTMKFAKQMTKSDKPAVSESRFRRVLEITDRDELYVSLIRLIRILGGNVNLRDLAESVYWWNKNTKKDWAYSYWEKQQ